MSETQFALIVTGREMRSSTGAVVGAEGERYWVAREPEGWVPATSIRVDGDDIIPGSAKTFATVAEAEDFAASWRGHPWWCSPRGEIEIVPVSETYRQVFAGYARRGPTVALTSSPKANAT